MAQIHPHVRVHGGHPNCHSKMRCSVMPRPMLHCWSVGSANPSVHCHSAGGRGHPSVQWVLSVCVCVCVCVCMFACDAAVPLRWQRGDPDPRF